MNSHVHTHIHTLTHTHRCAHTHAHSSPYRPPAPRSHTWQVCSVCCGVALFLGSLLETPRKRGPPEALLLLLWLCGHLLWEGSEDGIPITWIQPPLPTTTLLPAALSPGKFAGRDPDPATGTRKIKEINRTRCPEARGEDASQQSKLRRWGPSTSWSNRVHAQACPILCNPRNCSPPGSSVHGIILARTLEWVAVSSSRGSSPLRDHTITPTSIFCLLH